MTLPDFLNGFDPDGERDHIIRWLENWFAGFGPRAGAVIGISGGKDSTIMAALLARALGPDRATGLLLPNVVQDDIQDAKDVINALGIRNRIINIGPAVNAIYASIMGAVDMDDNYAGLELNDAVTVNTPPRVRMTLLRAVAAALPGTNFFINTCNRSEDYIGYSTKDGDAAGDIAPLSGYTVSEIIHIGLSMPEIPEHLVVKAPSDGLCGQTDELRFGFLYATLDQYILTGVCTDPLTRDRIDSMHRANLHKLLPMPYCKPLRDC